MKQTPLTTSLLVLVVLSEGCSWFRREPKTSPPPPSQATKTAPAGPTAPKRSPVVRSSPTARKKAQPALKPQPAEAGKIESAGEREPALGQIMTAQQRAEYQRTYESDSTAASQILASFSARRLAPEEANTVARIRSFLQQAAEAKASDWSLAANLARRAVLLARELAGRVE